MTNTTRRLAMVGLATLLVTAAPILAACSGNAEPVTGSEAVQTATSATAEASQASSPSSPAADAETQVQVGADLPLPDTWPAALPSYDGGRLVSVMVIGEGAEVNAIWATDAPWQVAAAAMAAAMQSAGYATDASTEAEDMSSVDFTGQRLHGQHHRLQR